MKHTKKGNQCYFGMKCHVGVDAESGIYTKVRYRGILKNALHLNTLCMLASLYLKRRVLAAAQG